jgi:surfeit locus 1 family protein
MKYMFRPNLWMTLATLAVMVVCIKAGLWQYNKAELKQALQTQLSTRLTEPPVALPDKIANLESWRYRRVKFSGVYNTRYQVLLDNQVENTVAGYHVLTPMQVEGSELYVLVNRGWIPKAAAQKGAQQQAPVVIGPKGRQEIIGDISLPAEKFFTLEAPPATNGKWQQVWQNLDMQRYVKSVPFTVQPFVVRIDAKSAAGGFVRNWPLPGERVSMHLGYAYQWFAFALTLLVIFIVLNVKKVRL